MFSLIRYVLLPATPALLLVATLVIAPSAEAQESHGDEKIATAAAAPLASAAIPGADIGSSEGRREAGKVEYVAADARDAPRCRRVERIGKFTVRRC